MTEKQQAASGDATPYAVIKTGGKQYRVSPGQIVSVEKLSGEVGDSVELSNVMLLKSAGADQASVGAPFIKDAKVTATIVDQTRGPKVLIFKKRRRKGYTKRQGHRQFQTTLRIENVG